MPDRRTAFRLVLSVLAALLSAQDIRTADHAEVRSPRIVSVVTDIDTGTLIVQGETLATEAAGPVQLTLARIPLTVLSATITEILARLPDGLGAGTHELVLHAERGQRKVRFVLAIGPTGPGLRAPRGRRVRAPSRASMGPSGFEGEWREKAPRGSPPLIWRGPWVAGQANPLFAGVPTNEPGGCCSEPLVAALYSVVTGNSSAAIASCGIQSYPGRTSCAASPAGVDGVGYPCFRPDALRVVLLVTDEAPLSGGTNHCPNWDAVVRPLALGSDVQLFVFNGPSLARHPHRHAGGRASTFDVSWCLPPSPRPPTASPCCAARWSTAARLPRVQRET